MQKHILLIVLCCVMSVLLCAGEKKAGWQDLFDGKTLAGWETLGKKSMTSDHGWCVKDGMLVFDPAEGKRGSIYTAKEYDNFILTIEWKINKGGNSGLKYRMRYYGKQYLGTEYQMLGDAGRKNDVHAGKLPPKTLKHITASLYDLLPPDTANWAPKPAGEWNKTKIVAAGSHIEHWLNGKKTIDVDLKSERFKKAVAASKFRSHKDFAQNKAGRIMLQDHGGKVWFRNIKIKVLKPKPAAAVKTSKKSK